MGLLQRLLGAVLGILFLLAVFVFASLALGILLAAGLLGWGWLWWRSRSGVKTSRGGTVVEGEYRDVTPSKRIEQRERL